MTDSLGESSDTQRQKPKRIFSLLLLAGLFVAGGYFIGNDITTKRNTGSQEAATLAALSPTDDLSGSRTSSFDRPSGLLDSPLLSSPTADEKKSSDPCEAPGVTCDYKSGAPQPVGGCVSPKTVDMIAACNKQKAIAAKQITAGIGAPAPTITSLQYSSTTCKVVTSVGEGKCKTDASKKCPTAHANNNTKCFWDKCPGSCLSSGPTSPSDGDDKGVKTPEEIQRDLLNQQYPDSIAPGESLASCKARGVCVDVADTSGRWYLKTDPAKSFTDLEFPEVQNFGSRGVANPDVLTGGAGADVLTGGGGADMLTGSRTTPDVIKASYSPSGVDPSLSGSKTTPINPTSLAGPGSAVPPGSSLTGSGIKNPGSVAQNVNPTSPYRSFRPPSNLQNPNSFIQRFVGGGPLTDLANFITGQAVLRNTPEGQQGGQPQVIYVTPQFAGTPGREYRSISELASDIAAQTEGASLARVDHFAQTLDAVGGPNEINTENKSFGRIQDLIVEDEAIRALRVAEEEGRRAKNSVFCRATETAESCNKRRVEKQEEVERATFIEELEKRVLPPSAIEHFLAVYDGWIVPSPAPATRATSTLGALHDQEYDLFAEYEITTSGTNFVLWIIDSVADAALNAVETFVNAITGNTGDSTEVERERGGQPN